MITGAFRTGCLVAPDLGGPGLTTPASRASARQPATLTDEELAKRRIEQRRVCLHVCVREVVSSIHERRLG